MEDRLQFRSRPTTTARRALLPPLLLQPLVENAVRARAGAQHRTAARCA
jgi:sensor histidine kinase YesM